MCVASCSLFTRLSLAPFISTSLPLSPPASPLCSRSRHPAFIILYSEHLQKRRSGGTRRTSSHVSFKAGAPSPPTPPPSPSTYMFKPFAVRVLLGVSSVVGLCLRGRRAERWLKVDGRRAHSYSWKQPRICWLGFLFPRAGKVSRYGFCRVCVELWMHGGSLRSR